MKIVSLNTFGGYAFSAFMEFVEREASTTDIFSFQEIYSAATPTAATSSKGFRVNLFEELIARLPDFVAYFSPVQDDFDLAEGEVGVAKFGLACFVRRSFTVVSTESIYLVNGYNTYVTGDYSTLGHNAFFIDLSIDGHALTVVGLHGMSEPGHKRDTPARLTQSTIILDALAARNGEAVVLGDFNLERGTESVRMFETAGMRNLIEEYRIATTRGSLHKALHPEYADTALGYQEFADFAFITPGIRMTSFEVPDLPLSDHLPMLLTFDILPERAD